jgi:hypothetical protein
MCVSDNVYMLKVSNMGTACNVVVTDRVWAVQLPQMLQDKGPCTIQVAYGLIQARNSVVVNAAWSKIWCESSIPIQGCSTEVGQGGGSQGIFSEIFNVDMNVDRLATEASYAYNMPYPVQFRCGGLPNTIYFQAMALDATQVGGAAFNPMYLKDAMTSTVPQVEFHLAIVFDRHKDVPK